MISNVPDAILQLVPHVPGGHEGVGDYALTLARQLLLHHGRRTVFGLIGQASVEEVEGFGILSPLSSISDQRYRDLGLSAIILHYVNYGYQKRGVPFSLPPLLRKLKTASGASLITIFHELHASGPPWKSAFWLRPAQVKIARQIAELSATCIVSSESTREDLVRIAPQARVLVLPVISNFGEPDLSAHQIAGRDQHRWAICGGTHLVERSLRSFLGRVALIPAPFFPHDLYVVGGKENATVRKAFERLPNVRCHYSPDVEVSLASGILSFCAFGWIDYFHRPGVATAAILKSTTFAACCAHGIIPVLPEAGSVISLRGDTLPGPFFVGREQTNLPRESERGKASHEFYAWYQRHASSKQLASGVAAALN